MGVGLLFLASVLGATAVTPLYPTCAEACVCPASTTAVRAASCGRDAALLLVSAHSYAVPSSVTFGATDTDCPVDVTSIEVSVVAHVRSLSCSPAFAAGEQLMLRLRAADGECAWEGAAQTLAEAVSQGSDALLAVSVMCTRGGESTTGLSECVVDPCSPPWLAAGPRAPSDELNAALFEHRLHEQAAAEGTAYARFGRTDEVAQPLPRSLDAVVACPRGRVDCVCPAGSEQAQVESESTRVFTVRIVYDTACVPASTHQFTAVDIVPGFRVTADGTRHSNDKWLWNRPRDISFTLVGPSVPDVVVVAIVRTWSGLTDASLYKSNVGDVIWFAEHQVDHSASGRQVLADVILGSHNPAMQLQSWLSTSLLSAAMFSQADSAAFLSAAFGASERSGDLHVAVFDLDQWRSMLLKQAETSAQWEDLPVAAQPTFVVSTAAAVGGSFSILFQGCTTARALTVLDSEDGPVDALGTSASMHLSVGMCMPVAMCGSITTGRSTGQPVGDEPCRWVAGLSAGEAPVVEDVCCDINPRSSLETKGFASDDSFRSFVDVLASDVFSFTLGTTLTSWLGLVDAEGLMFTLPGNSASGFAVDLSSRIAEADGLTGDEFLATFAGTSSLLRAEARAAAFSETADTPQKRQAPFDPSGRLQVQAAQWRDDLRLLSSVAREYSNVWGGLEHGYKYTDPNVIADLAAILDDVVKNYDDILAFLQRTNPESAAKFAALAANDLAGLFDKVYGGATRVDIAPMSSMMAEFRKLMDTASSTAYVRDGGKKIRWALNTYMETQTKGSLSTVLYSVTNFDAQLTLGRLLANVPELAPSSIGRATFPWPSGSHMLNIFSRFDEAKLVNTVPANMATAKMLRSVDWLVEDGKSLSWLLTAPAPYPNRLAPPAPGFFKRFSSSFFGCVGLRKRAVCKLGSKVATGNKLAKSAANLVAVGLSFDLALSSVHPSLGCGLDRAIGDGPSRCMQTMTIGSDILLSWTAAGWLGLDRADILEEVGGTIRVCRDDLTTLPGAPQVCWQVGVRSDSWLPPSGIISSLYPESGVWVPLVGTGAVEGAYYLPGALHRFTLQFPDEGASVDSLPFVATAAGCEYDVSNRVVGLCIEPAACDGHYGGQYRMAVEACGTSLVCCRDDRRLANEQFRGDALETGDSDTSLSLGALIAVVVSVVVVCCVCALAVCAGLLIVRRRSTNGTAKIAASNTTTRAPRRHSRSPSSLRRTPSTSSSRRF